MLFFSHNQFFCSVSGKTEFIWCQNVLGRKILMPYIWKYNVLFSVLQFFSFSFFSSFLFLFVEGGVKWFSASCCVIPVRMTQLFPNNTNKICLRDRLPPMCAKNNRESFDRKGFLWALEHVSHSFCKNIQNRLNALLLCFRRNLCIKFDTSGVATKLVWPTSTNQSDTVGLITEKSMRHVPYAFLHRFPKWLDQWISSYLLTSYCH